MAWGTPAGKRVLRVDGERHLVLKSVHPSPLSASRGFFECGHFKAANEWLVKRYGEDGDIDWSLTAGKSTKVAVKKVEAEGLAKVAVPEGAAEVAMKAAAAVVVDEKDDEAKKENKKPVE